MSMDKNTFLQTLSNHLQSLPEEERREIIADFEEHFSAGLELGKTEMQICLELGDPAACARQYLGGNADATAAKRTAHAQKSTAYAPKSPQMPYGAKPVNEERNRTLWQVLFVFAILAAFAVYPTALALMLTGVLIPVFAIFSFTEGLVGLTLAFFAVFCLFLFSLGLLLFLVMTWFLRLSSRKAGI